MIGFTVMRLKPEADAGLARMSFREMEMRGLFPQLTDYDVLFTRLLSNEEIGEIMSGRHEWIAGGAIRVSDVVRINGESGPRFYYRDTNGYVQLEYGFEIFQITTQDGELMILVVPPTGKPYPLSIKPSMEAMQAIVGGSADVDLIDDGNAIIVVNKDAQKADVPFNRTVDGKGIKGIFIICGMDEQKNPRSLSAEQFTQFYFQFGFTLM